MKIININEWERKVQYEFFKDFEDPFFSTTSNINCSNLYRKCKEIGRSFFTAYMHKALKAINEIPEFRTRLVEDKVVLYDKINGSTTVFKENNTFSFCYFDYLKDFDQFDKNTRESINLAKNSDSLVSKQELDLIYVSVIPWRSFTSLKHPRSGNKTDSVPRLVFGKVFEQDNKFLMPVTLDAHHSLADGFHASKFYNRFEELIQSE